METKKLIRISVRNLVEFVLREGDIDNRRTGSSEKEAMQMGARIHRKIQRQMGSSYRAEVPLKIQLPYEEFDLQIEGRADGIQEVEGSVLIDEIKGILFDLSRLEEPIMLHQAQAKCYAYIYGNQQNLSEITVQLTYCQMETEEIKRFQETYSMKELEEWFFMVIEKYEKWAYFQVEWERTRTRSIKQTVFPYAYREGQKELAMSVYRTFLREKKLFIQAPTGVGKTMATIFPAVKAVGEGVGEKIFYLTAKTITRTVATQAFEHLRQQGLRMKTVTLTAKDKICFCEEKECNPSACPYAKGHYDRVNDAVYQILTSADDMGRGKIEEIAKEHQVCPFEMSLDVSLWTDAVICDYNYVLDPNAHLRRFFSEGKKGKYLFLIDEAHNLVERGREMYSAVLYKEQFLEIKKKMKVYPKLVKNLEACNKLLLEMKRECESYQVHKSIAPLCLKLLNIQGILETVLEENKQLDDDVLEFYFDVRMFLTVHEALDENYVIYTELEEDGRFKIKLFCVNPAVNLENYLNYGVGTVFFSATLLPIQYYKKLLSVEKDDYAIYAESPFDENKRLVLLGGDVSTKYTQRNQITYQKYADYIRKIVEAKSGNYLVFFPSYRFMESVVECFTKEELGTIRYVVQKLHMDEIHREEFLKQFEEPQKGSLIGFCVLGGLFSEGIDLTRESLIGAIIVGTGLPQVCNEREILRQYFLNRQEKGFEYAYLYPGMNKVLQAAGRVIRTEKDVGTVILLDERFKDARYVDNFPREWKKIEQCNLLTVGECVEQFWKKAYTDEV